MKNTNSTLNGEDLKNITSRVIYLRNQILHMTQSEFASVLKMSQTYLSLIESGKKAITKPTIDNILSTFKVNMEWLLFGIGTMMKSSFQHHIQRNILQNLLRNPHCLLYKTLISLKTMKQIL